MINLTHLGARPDCQTQVTFVPFGILCRSGLPSVFAWAKTRYTPNSRFFGVSRQRVSALKQEVKNRGPPDFSTKLQTTGGSWELGRAVSFSPGIGCGGRPEPQAAQQVEPAAPRVDRAGEGVFSLLLRAIFLSIFFWGGQRQGKFVWGLVALQVLDVLQSRSAWKKMQNPQVTYGSGILYTQ